MATFEVRVVSYAQTSGIVVVSADSPEEAAELAIEEAKNGNVAWDDFEDDEEDLDVSSLRELTDAKV